MRKYLLAYIFASTYLHIMETRRDVFHAIVDPTRREIISLVSRHPVNLNTVAEQFNMSRQAVSLHVKVLTECGLITIKQHGRERFCEANLSGLNEISQWVDQYRQHWESRLNALEKHLAIIQKSKKNVKRKK